MGLEALGASSIAATRWDGAHSGKCMSLRKGRGERNGEGKG